MLTDSMRAGYERSANNLGMHRMPKSLRERRAHNAARAEMAKERVVLNFECICNRAARLLRECIRDGRTL